MYLPRAGMKICSSLLKVYESVTYLQCAAVIYVPYLCTVVGPTNTWMYQLRECASGKKINISAINIAERAGDFDIYVVTRSSVIR